MFIANISFLFTELPFLDRFDAAAKAGFEAVECHWPYDHAFDDIRAAMRDSGMGLHGLNTGRGNAGEFGLAALPGREADFAASFDEALDYARALEIPMIHVMAGVPEDALAGEATYRANLAAACARAPEKTLLIEPINARDVPGYMLASTGQAAAVIAAVAAGNLAMMFDAYHVQIAEGDVTRRFARHLPRIAHVQIAAVPDRGEPDDGELDYAYVIKAMRAAGYRGAISAEYRPRGRTEDRLGWLTALA